MSENQDDDKTRSYTPLTKDTMVGHYRIINKIGAGGMGEIYLAEDTRLNRSVTLKFLTRDLCSDDECKARFIREAQAAAKLNHPNIVTIHEVSEFGQRPFIVMEYIDGYSLEKPIAERSYDLEQNIKLMIEICQGLLEAHENNIIHRDLKPSNILLDRRGRPRILDFGLAIIKGKAKITRTGTMLGTMGYMSPEQITGLDVDHRSDIFSLGVLFYEMICGLRPFDDDYEAAILYNIAYEPAPPLTNYISDVPENLSVIFDSFLAKDPDKRYQSLAEVISALQEFQGIAPGVKDKPASGDISESAVRSLAILYLKNLGSEEDDFLCFGVTEDLIVDLTRLDSIRVSPMRSILPFKDSEAGVEEIGQKLKADLILDGSIYKTNESIRVSAQLIEAEKGNIYWADRWEAPTSDITKIKQALADGVTKALQISARKVDLANVGRPEGSDPLAYENYLRAKYTFEHKKGISDIKIATGLYEQALKQESTLIAAKVGLAEIHLHLGNFDRVEQDLRKAMEMALTSNSRPEQAHILRLKTRLYSQLSKWPEGAEAANQALEIDRQINDLVGEAQTLGLLISILQRQSKFNKALECFDRVLEIGYRLNDQQKIAEALKNAGVTYSRKGDFDQAIKLYEEALQIGRTQEDLLLQAACLSNIGNIHYFRGEYDDAYSRYCKSHELYNRLSDQAGTARQSLNMGLVQVLKGESEQALLLLQESAKIFRNLGDRSTYAMTLTNMAQIYINFGQDQKAIDVSNEAIEIARDINQPLAESNALIQLGFAYIYRREFDLAREQIEIGLKISSENKITRNICHLNFGHAVICYLENDWINCRSKAQEAFQLAKEIGEKKIILGAGALLSAVEAITGMYFGGLKQLRQSYEEASKSEDKGQILLIMILLGEVLFRFGRSEEEKIEGRRFLDDARTTAIFNKFSPETKWIDEILSEEKY